MKKHFFNLIILLCAFVGLSNAQPVVSKAELAEKQYYIQPTDRNFRNTGRTLPLDTLIEYIGANVSNRKVFSTVAQLRQTAGTINNEKADLIGYYASGDNGDGVYYWNASSMAPDNGGTVISVNNTLVGRWIRLISNTVNIKAFGAKGDGIFNNTIAIQSAINAVSAKNGGSVIIEAGNYIIDNSLIIPSNVQIIGVSKWNLGNSFNYLGSGDSPQYNQTKITLKNNSNVDVIIFDSLCVNSSLKNLFIDGNKTNQTKGNGISFRNAKTKIVRGSNKIEEVYVYAVKDTGVVIRNKTYEVYLDKVYADRSGKSGIFIAGQDCSVFNSLAGYNGTYGFEVTFGGALRSYNCDAFGNINAGLFVHDVKSCRFIGFQSNSNYKEGVLISNVSSYSPSRIQFVGCSFFGNSVEYTTTSTRYAEFQLTAPSGGGPFAITLSNCIFGIFGGTSYCSYAISDTSPVKRVNSLVGCQFESTVYSSATFQNIVDVYQIFGCLDSINGLINSIGTNLHTNTKVNNIPVATESLGYDYKISNFTIEASKRFIAINAASSAITATLPLANSVLAGKEIILRKHDSSSNVITVALSGSNAFAVGTISSISSQGQVRRFISDGVNTWFNSN